MFLLSQCWDIVLVFVSLGEVLYPHLMRQGLQVQCAEMAAGLYALRGIEMAHELTGPVTRG